MRLRNQRAPLRATLFAAACAFALSYPTEAPAQLVVHQTNLVTDNAAFLASQNRCASRSFAGTTVAADAAVPSVAFRFTDKAAMGAILQPRKETS